MIIEVILFIMHYMIKFPIRASFPRISSGSFLTKIQKFLKMFKICETFYSFRNFEKNQKVTMRHFKFDADEMELKISFVCFLNLKVKSLNLYFYIIQIYILIIE